VEEDVKDEEEGDLDNNDANDKKDTNTDKKDNK
jgi:hypothetical protein